jgi:hypothetical protein
MLRGTVVTLTALAAAATAAVPAAGAEAGKPDRTESTFTLGRVQQELRAGLSQAEVAERLGAPNILTRDGQGREAWVYDRVSSEVLSSGSAFSIGLGGAFGSDSVGGLFGIGGSGRRQRTRSSQQTLTVVVRFSAEGEVTTFSWHHSRF